jgi:hypothetical protein
MSAVRFLIDESLPRALVTGLRRREPTLDVARVGQPRMPPHGTPDEALLQFCEAEGRMFVSCDRATIPAHLQQHLQAGGHTFGVVLVASGCGVGKLIDDLLLVWGASQADEWHDRLFYLPLFRE